MSVYDEATATGISSLETSEEEILPKYVQNQSEFMDKMKQCLLSQQQSLRQSLENARRKSEASNPPGTVNALASNKVPNVTHDRSDATEIPKIETTPKQRFEIQICPVCGLEFDGSNRIDALEIHVAEHWCSPSSE